MKRAVAETGELQFVAIAPNTEISIWYWEPDICPTRGHYQLGIPGVGIRPQRYPTRVAAEQAAKQIAL